jgi:hypothetical protein
MDREAHRSVEAPPSESNAPGDEGEVLAAHLGRSANCSSVGSVVDVLFVSSVVGSAILLSLGVLLRSTRRDDDEAPREDGDDEEAP